MWCECWHHVRQLQLSNHHKSEDTSNQIHAVMPWLAKVHPICQTSQLQLIWYIKQSAFMVLWNNPFPYLGDPIPRIPIGHWFQCGYGDRCQPSNWMLIGILMQWWVPYCFYYIRVVTSTSPLTHSLHIGKAVWEVCHSLRPGLLRGNSLDREIFDDRRHVDVYMPSVGCPIVVHVLLLEDVEGLGWMSGTLLAKLVGSGIAPDIGVGTALISHFLRKQWFLTVILPYPSVLIQYWWSRRKVMILPVVC